MAETTPAPLDVSFVELPNRKVVFLAYQAGQKAGDFDRAIRDTFDRVKTWVKQRGGSITSAPAIGIAQVMDGQLESYECCIPVEDLRPTAQDDLSFKVLPGGWYAVLRIEKRPEIIGQTIGRFYQEYAPNARLAIDTARPTYEVYWDRSMEFCVPVIR